MYRAWWRAFPEYVEVCSIQPPGREHRLAEPALREFRPYVESLTETLVEWLDLPCMFFGHSLGALAAFEVARLLRERSASGPRGLFASACRAPQSAVWERKVHDLPDALFVEELRRLNGTPQEALDHPELMELMLPIVKADFAVYESYEYAAGDPLDCPIHVLGGVGDERVTRDDLAGWGKQTTAGFSVRMFPGDHFFLHPAQRAIVNAVTTELERSLSHGR